MKRFTAWLPETMIGRIDAWAKTQGPGLKTSTALRLLLDRALSAAEGPAPEPEIAELMARLNAKSDAELLRTLATWFRENEGMTDLAPTPDPKPGIVERGMKALKSMAGDQSLSPSQRQAAKKG